MLTLLRVPCGLKVQTKPKKFDLFKILLVVRLPSTMLSPSVCVFVVCAAVFGLVQTANGREKKILYHVDGRILRISK